MDVVPTRFSLADDGNVLTSQDQVCKFVCLSASSVQRASSTPVDGRWAEDSCLDRLRSSCQHKVVDILVESILWQSSQVLHGCPIVVFTFRPFAQLVVVSHSLPAQDTSATSVQPESRLFLGVARCQTLCDRFRGAFVVRCIRSVCESLTLTALSLNPMGNSRITTSAFAASSSRILESSKPPITIRTLGKASVTDLAFSSIPSSVCCTAHRESTNNYLSAQEPQSRNQSACCTAQRGCRLQYSQLRRC